MTTTKKTKKVDVVDLMDHYELLLLFRQYVDQCIGDYNHSSKPRPISFDEWYNVEYLPNIESLTQVIVFQATWYLGGNKKGSFHCRIPVEIVSEDGDAIFDTKSLFRFAKKLKQHLNHPQMYINYRDDWVYRWSNS